MCMPRPGLRRDGGHKVRTPAALPLFAPKGPSPSPYAGRGMLPPVQLLWDAGEPHGHGTPGNEGMQSYACG